MAEIGEEIKLHGNQGLREGHLFSDDECLVLSRGVYPEVLDVGSALWQSTYSISITGSYICTVVFLSQGQADRCVNAEIRGDI
jgi:hypothetical protein